MKIFIRKNFNIFSRKPFFSKILLSCHWRRKIKENKIIGKKYMNNPEIISFV
jgi:hypothetical protein